MHTSAAAETGFLLGLFALFAAPFSVMHGLALGAAALGAVVAFVGVVRTSNHPDIAGRAIAPLGVAFSLVALMMLGLRYIGVDTAFGDGLVPTLAEWLAWLNEQVPNPND